MTTTKGPSLVERLNGPHEWGYRDPVEGGWIEDLSPFEAASYITELEGERRSIIANIPMDYLKAHDAAGAAAPTASLDLVGAMRAYAEARWRIIDRCKEAEARAETATDQLKHWFELATKIDEEAAPTVLAGLQGYLRTARNGGMPRGAAEAAGRVLEDYCRLYLGRDLVPVLRGISDARAEAAEANSARLVELAATLDRMALDRQEWADHPGIGGNNPGFASHLRGKRYGYSHAAQLIRAALEQTKGESA